MVNLRKLNVAYLLLIQTLSVGCSDERTAPREDDEVQSKPTPVESQPATPPSDEPEPSEPDEGATHQPSEPTDTHEEADAGPAHEAPVVEHEPTEIVDSGVGGAGGSAGSPSAAGASAPGAAGSSGRAAEGGAGAGGAAGIESAGSGGASASNNAGAGGGVAAPDAGQTAEPIVLDTEPSDEAVYLFDPSKLRTYDIQVAEADLAKINANPAAEAKVNATLVFEGKTYGPYSVRYKGSAGSFRAPCVAAIGAPKDGKCSLKLDFNDLDDEAKFFGLKKLNFHAMNADASQLRDRLGYQLFREMDVAAPRSVHARVSINGQLQGLFIAVEQIDGRFTRARFSDGGEGNIYKEVWPVYTDAATYQKALETNEEAGAVQRMLDFQRAVTTSADAAASWLDGDYLARYLAVDRVIINDDGIMRFWCGAISQGNNPGPWGNHNYYWYEAEKQNRFWLLPWDLDNSFDNTQWVHVDPEWNAPSEDCSCRNNQYGTQRASSCDPVIQRFIAWQAPYEQQVAEFLAGPFAKAHVDALLDAWTTQIQAATVEAEGLPFALSEASWADGVMTLRSKIDAARKNHGYAY